MLTITNGSKVYGRLKAVDDVSVAVPRGQFAGVIGRSGAGKSTLLRLINRLADPTSGEIVWNGSNVSRLRGAELRDWRRRCAMIFQQFNLVGRLDVLTNVLMGRLGHTAGWRSMIELWPARDREIAIAALDHFDIASLSAQRANQLSGGQEQRVAICRALVQEPELILADEPVASLDPRNTKLVMDALARINAQFGITVVVNLHSLDLARTYCDRLIGMAAGKVVFDGVPETLTDDVAHALYGIEANEVVDTSPARERAAAVAEAAAA